MFGLVKVHKCLCLSDSLLILIILSFILFFFCSISDPKRCASVLKEVGEKIKSYPFNFKGAAIISGQKEGAYGWVTVNYLLENFIKVY